MESLGSNRGLCSSFTSSAGHKGSPTSGSPHRMALQQPPVPTQCPKEGMQSPCLGLLPQKPSQVSGQDDHVEVNRGDSQELTKSPKKRLGEGPLGITRCLGTPENLEKHPPHQWQTTETLMCDCPGPCFFHDQLCSWPWCCSVFSGVSEWCQLRLAPCHCGSLAPHALQVPSQLRAVPSLPEPGLSSRSRLSPQLALGPEPSFCSLSKAPATRGPLRNNNSSTNVNHGFGRFYGALAKCSANSILLNAHNRPRK
ncbi:hypothetical protein H1C71_011378 [Ictidomys tridecemlineatus]|nr:hypothetical protein H1C71_011378 [Ictidomys tridecemlineatus]